MRNTCASERMRETGRSSEPWIRTLSRGSGSLAETNFDVIRQRLSECLQPFLPALLRVTRLDYSQKPGVERSSHNESYAKHPSVPALFFCRQPPAPTQE